LFSVIPASFLRISAKTPGASCISAASCVTAVASVIAVACVPAVGCESTFANILLAGVLLVPNVLTVAGRNSCVAGVSAFPFVPAAADVLTFAGVPVVDGGLTVASFPTDPGVPFVL
jgi:hypothetical protein